MVKVVQFGEGGFLRAFADYMIDIANEKGVFSGKVAIVKPIPFGTLEKFAKQDCKYNVVLRGIVDGKVSETTRKINCIETAVDPYTQYDEYINLARLESVRFIISNTTEAGIVYDENDSIKNTPPTSYPGKLTQFLYERYKHFNRDTGKGVIILPVELIDRNGDNLKSCVLKQCDNWGLEDGFKTWLECCTFCNTLVDRVVTGYNEECAKALNDELVVTGEPFALWAIEAPDFVENEFTLKKADLPVVFCDNLALYRERKVRILNGTHTATVLAAYLSGLDVVEQFMKDADFKKYVRNMVYDEIIPNVPLEFSEVDEYAKSVFERFENPFVKHQLLSISLNSVSKWKARILPSVTDYYKKNGKAPRHLAFSLAALIAFYTSGGKRGEERFEIRDDEAVLDFFKNADGDIVKATLSNESLWGCDLTALCGFEAEVTKHFENIKTTGVKYALGEI